MFQIKYNTLFLKLVTCWTLFLSSISPFIPCLFQSIIQVPSPQWQLVAMYLKLSITCRGFILWYTTIRPSVNVIFPLVFCRWKKCCGEGERCCEPWRSFDPWSSWTFSYPGRTLSLLPFYAPPQIKRLPTNKKGTICVAPGTYPHPFRYANDLISIWR